MLRDRLLARLAEMGDAPDHQRLADEELGIRGAPPELARRLVAQALVLEDRRDVWRRAGERICRDAPATPGVYVLKDADGRALYVGKAVNLRRRLRAHFAERPQPDPELIQLARALQFDLPQRLQRGDLSATEALLLAGAVLEIIEPDADARAQQLARLAAQVLPPT